MRVTDEMVDRACDELSSEDIYRERVVAALEAALADVPEPNDDYKGVWLAAIEMLRRERAKLAKVRAWAEFFTPESVGEPELWAILDEP